MEAFWKTLAVIILAILLGAALGKGEKDISAALSVVSCCIVLTTAMEYLSEVVAFLWELGNTQEGQIPFLSTLLKISGVALTTELTELLSSDAGNSALGKAMQILGNAAVLFLALPLFESFFGIIQELMRMV